MHKPTKLPSPQTAEEFEAMFPDEIACQDYIFAIRFEKGFVCVKCGSTKYHWFRPRRTVTCGNNHQTAVGSGTIMHRAHQGLLPWFKAAFLMATMPPKTPITWFARDCGIKVYETAYLMYHRLLIAMGVAQREDFKGTFEDVMRRVIAAKPVSYTQIYASPRERVNGW